MAFPQKHCKSCPLRHHAVSNPDPILLDSPFLALPLPLQSSQCLRIQLQPRIYHLLQVIALHCQLNHQKDPPKDVFGSSVSHYKYRSISIPSNLSFSLILVPKKQLELEHVHKHILPQVSCTLYVPFPIKYTCKSHGSLRPSQIHTPTPSSTSMASSLTPHTTHSFACSAAVRSTIKKFGLILLLNTKASNSLAILTVPLQPCLQKTTRTSYTLQVRPRSLFLPSMGLRQPLPLYRICNVCHRGFQRP